MIITIAPRMTETFHQAGDWFQQPSKSGRHRVESGKQPTDVKKSRIAQRGKKTISYCSKGWTGMRNDQSAKARRRHRDRKGCGDSLRAAE